MAEVKWFGHGCFRLRGREATVLMDPVGRGRGYTLPKQKANIVTVSHQHPGHNALAHVQEGYFLIDGPGEFEVNDVFVTGIRTYHDNERGALHGYNTVYMLELDEVRFCHLGDLGHALTDEQAEALSDIDVLLVPVGGGRALDTVAANEVIGQIEPKIVVPMHYRTNLGDTDLQELERFTKELGLEQVEPREKLTIRKSDLPESMQVVVLAP